MRGRYLFYADRDVRTYRDVLEVRPGRARLLTPSAAARAGRWISSIALFIAYSTIMSPVLLIGAAGGLGILVPGWIAFLATGTAWVAGLILVFAWWDRRNLPTLVEDPARAVDLRLVGTRSFGAYQEVRAKAPGEDLRLVVDARADRFLEAVRLYERATSDPVTDPR